MTKPKFLTPENIAIALTVLGVCTSVAVAYGSLVTTQNSHEIRLIAVEQAPLDIAAIKASQASMEKDIEEIRRDQRVILQAVTK